MENKTEKAVNALKEIETYCNVHCLEELEYAIAVMEKFAEAGIKDALEADFSLLEKRD